MNKVAIANLPHSVPTPSKRDGVSMRTVRLGKLFRYGATKAAEKGIRAGDGDSIVHAVRAKHPSR